MWIDLADVDPVKQSVLISRQMSVVVLVLHPTMVDDEDHQPVECHNSNYGKG